MQPPHVLSPIFQMLRNLECACSVDNDFGYFNYEHFFITYQCFTKVSLGTHYVTREQLSNHADGGAFNRILHHMSSEKEGKNRQAAYRDFKGAKVWDLVRPASSEFITLHEIKKSRAITFFFNIFINWSKYVSHLVPRCDGRSVRLPMYNLSLKGATDLFWLIQMMETGLTDWDRFCREQHAMYRAIETSADEDSDDHHKQNEDEFDVRGPFFCNLRSVTTACRSVDEKNDEDRSELDVQTAVEGDGESFGEEQERMLEQYAESLLDEDENLVLEDCEDKITKGGGRQIIKGIGRRIFKRDERRMTHKTYLRAT
uniref:Uncharacterized protein n=1 Tax=Parascaris equorum TaxID=6256 RepID=A0A914R7T2_PAREQ